MCMFSGDHTLPNSNHGIFTSLVQNSLKRYLEDRLGSTTRVGDITSPDSLPSEIRAPFVQLCRLAFYGIENDKVTFSANDLSTPPEDVCKIGLLQSIPSIISDGRQVYFCFLHLSIHELLASIHISLLPPKQQISIFQKLFKSPRFSAVFQFYAGITKLRTKRPLLSRLPRFLCPVPTSVYDLLREIVTSKDKPLLVSLLHCLYEAEDRDLCVFVADLLDHRLSLTGTTLSPLDCLSVGYFSSAVSVATSGRFTVDLGGCSIGDQGCKFLSRGLSKCYPSESNVTTQLDVDLTRNNIHEEGTHYVVLLLDKITGWLDLSDNAIGDSWLKSLCEVLTTNTTLEGLHLWRCSLTVSDCSTLCEMLTMNKSLKTLGLSGNEVTDCRHIAAGLKHNTTLTELNLSRCHLTDQCLRDLATGMNNIIEVLYIHGNDLITEEGLRTFASHLSTLSRLRHLWIPEHLESSKDTVFKSINEERKRNGLPEIGGECVYSMLHVRYP